MFPFLHKYVCDSKSFELMGLCACFVGMTIRGTDNLLGRYGIWICINLFGCPENVAP